MYRIALWKTPAKQLCFALPDITKWTAGIPQELPFKPEFFRDWRNLIPSLKKHTQRTYSLSFPPVFLCLREKWWSWFELWTCYNPPRLFLSLVVPWVFALVSDWFGFQLYQYSRKLFSLFDLSRTSLFWEEDFKLNPAFCHSTWNNPYDAVFCFKENGVLQGRIKQNLQI